MPGTPITTFSMSRPMRSISARSGPATLIPTGVLIPVASMSMRVLIGITQALVTPGYCTAASNASMIFRESMPSRHSSFGFSWMTVSIMVRGAGSVAVSARPILPNTCLTSGTARIRRSVCCSSSWALPIDRPGRVVGMYIRSPSSSSGMNSEPRPSAKRASQGVSRKLWRQSRLRVCCARVIRSVIGWGSPVIAWVIWKGHFRGARKPLTPLIGMTRLKIANRARTRVNFGRRITAVRAGRYSQIRNTLSGVLSSAGIRPRPWRRFW